MVVAVQGDPVAAVLFLNLESGVVMDAWEEPAADQRIEPRRRVAPRDEDALAPFAALVPLDGDAVGGVLRGDARGNPARVGAGRALSRMRQTPAIPLSLTSLGRNGFGSSRDRTPGSTR